jgi:hypothetical protein
VQDRQRRAGAIFDQGQPKRHDITSSGTVVAAQWRSRAKLTTHLRVKCDGFVQQTSSAQPNGRLGVEDRGSR